MTLLPLVSPSDVPDLPGALCARPDVNPDWWFPHPGSDAGVVVAICKACPEQTACLAWAIQHGEDEGVWGGVTEKRRRRLAKGTAAVCGTTGGYRAHTERGEEHCRACKDAEAAYSRARRERDRRRKAAQRDRERAAS